MTTPLSETATVRDLLFGDTPAAPADTVADALRAHGTVRALTPGLPGLVTAAESAVADATASLLSVSLADVAVDGWKKYDQLRQAAKRTRAAPTATEVVEMLTHKITSSRHPAVELSADGVSIGTLDITVQITFTLSGVRAVVKHGRLTAIQTGKCTATGSLDIAGAEVTKKERSFDLPGAVRFRRGIDLLGAGPDARNGRAASAQITASDDLFTFGLI
jgi:hypothetical protein